MRQIILTTTILFLLQCEFENSSSLNQADSNHCTFNGEPEESPEIRLVERVSGLTRPVDFVGLNVTEALVLEQRGVITKVNLQTGSKQVILDMQAIVNDRGNEAGLLGIALHPNFTQNNKFYLNYTRGNLKTQVSEFTWANRNQRVSLNTEKRILDFPQPRSNHNGGGLAFGPEGYLHIAVGDGGKQRDPDGNAQNLGIFLGSILRVDINTDQPYLIPPTNPFVGESNVKKEIFAYGFRNPWRITFDKLTGRLWTADVGQNRQEEIDIVINGGNYGWNIVEGENCTQLPCDKSRYVAPVAVYGRTQGVSVTGGYVYRGTKIPQLVGQYIYADYVTGIIWGLKYDEENGSENTVLLNSNQSISSFGQGVDGSLYAMEHERGSIFEFLPKSSDDEQGDFPLNLSDTGCFDSLTPLSTVENLIPYNVNAPLWSDGTVKTRYIKLPQNGTISFNEGNWDFPIGTVLVKHFEYDDKPLETRFIVKKTSGFKSYGYRWNEQLTDAVFLGEATSKILSTPDGGSFEYVFPSQANCRQCHDQSKNEVLGFNLKQLNIETSHGNQIHKLTQAGIFATESVPSDLSQFEKLVDPSASSESIEGRARSWLDTQCSTCHNLNNPANQGEMEYTFGVPFSEMGLCNVIPQNSELGHPDNRILVPGRPERSLIHLRIGELGKNHMPAVGTTRLDPVGVPLIEQWISQIESCN